MTRAVTDTADASKRPAELTNRIGYLLKHAQLRFQEIQRLATRWTSGIAICAGSPDADGAVEVDETLVGGVKRASVGAGRMARRWSRSPWNAESSLFLRVWCNRIARPIISALDRRCN